MNASKLIVSIVLACAYLGGCTSSDTPAVSAAAPASLPSEPDKAHLEDNPERLKAFSCEKLDEAMSMNYTLACLWETTGNPTDQAIADFSAQKFKVQQKEYKSRCKAKPAKLAEAKRNRSHRACKLLPKV